MHNENGYLGVAGLDELIPDGLPYNNQILLRGETGIGKSVLAAQFLYEGLIVGDTCVYIACDDVPDSMRQSLKSFRMGSMAYEQAGRLIFVDAYSRTESKETYWIPEPQVLDEFYLYERELLERLSSSSNRVRLIVDSLSTPFIQNDSQSYVTFNVNRLKFLRRMGVFTLDAFVKGVLDDRSMQTLSHMYPVIINMDFQSINGSVRRIIQLGKLKSGQFQASHLAFTIGPSTGIIIGG